MNDEQAFLAAIAACPGDHLPLLQYDDWLGERGEAAREEFLRLWHKEAGFKVNSANYLNAKVIINRRLESLATGFDPAWLAAIGFTPPVPHVRITFIEEMVDRLDRTSLRGPQRYIDGLRSIRASAISNVPVPPGTAVIGVADEWTITGLVVRGAVPDYDSGRYFMQLVSDGQCVFTRDDRPANPELPIPT